VSTSTKHLASLMLYRFLWASLQISQILNNRTPTLIRRALQNMPSKIFDVFTDTLERIGDDDLARRCLFWLAKTDEPLQYSALSHALAVDPQYTTPDGIDVDDIPGIEDLVEICCGLVAVDADMNLRFVHFTVQEYFSQHPECLLPLDNLIIAKTCLSYLSFKEFESGYCDSEEKMQRRLEQYPLYSFAARRWNHFVRKTAEHEVVDAILHIYLHKGLFDSYAQARHVEWTDEARYKSGKYFGFQDGYSPLHDATDVGILSILERILSRISNPSPRMRGGIMPLHLAVAQRRPDIVSLLTMAGAEQTSRASLTVQSNTTDGHVTVIKRHYVAGVTHYHEGTQIWSEEYTPVALAAAIGSRPLYDQLKDKTNFTLMGGVLETATSRGLVDMVQQVLVDTPGIDYRHPSFARALQNSVRSASPLFQLLLAAKAELDDHNGMLSKLLPDAIRHHPRAVDMLVQKGASTDGWMCENWWYSPLKAAFEGSDESMIIYLIEKGANFGAPNNLCRAAEKGMKNVVELLLNRGMDINGYPADHDTALHSAAYADKVEMIELLLNRGADIDLAPNRLTALTKAARSGRINAVRKLISRGANVNASCGNPSPLEQAAYNAYDGDEDKITIVGLLLDHGADINGISGGNDNMSMPTALCAAVLSGNLELCELLLSRGADPNFLTMKNSPLMIACDTRYQPVPNRKINKPVIELLLEYGADPNAGCAALEHAVYNGDDSIVQLLLEHGAKIDFRGGTYGSILHAAAQSRNGKMVQIMLERGAKVIEEDRRYGGLLALAGPTHHNILIQHGADVNARGRKHGPVLQATIVQWYKCGHGGQQRGSNILEVRELMRELSGPFRGARTQHRAMKIPVHQSHGKSFRREAC
jgi:ankyrin repeat protein